MARLWCIEPVCFMTALTYGSVLYQYHLASMICWLGNEAVTFVYKQFCIARDDEDYRRFCKICFTTYENPVIAVKNVEWKNGWMWAHRNRIRMERLSNARLVRGLFPTRRILPIMSVRITATSPRRTPTRLKRSGHKLNPIRFFHYQAIEVCFSSTVSWDLCA